MDQDLKVPLTAERAPLAKHIPELIIPKERVFDLENKIPLDLLYKSVKQLQDTLEQKNKSQGYMNSVDDIEEPHYPDEFAHILEHAILSVMDNNLSVGTVSTGRTTAAGLVQRDHHIYSQERISHHHEIRIRFSPTVPKQLHQKYVDEIISGIAKQYKDTQNIDLNLIHLT